MPELMDIVNFIGDVLDTPGAMLRSGLIGKNPLSGVFDTSQRASGRDVLEHYGIAGQNQKGLDAGDVGGFAAEMVLDPTNLIGGGLLARLMGKASKAKAKNVFRQAAINKGGMTELDQAATKVRQITPTGKTVPGQVVVPNRQGDDEVVRYLSTQKPFILSKRSKLEDVNRLIGRNQVQMNEYEPWMDDVISEYDRLRDFADEAKTVSNTEVYRTLENLGLPDRHLVDAGYDSVIRPSLADLLRQAQESGVRTGPELAPSYADHLPFAQILDGGNATIHRRLVPAQQPVPSAKALLAMLFGQNVTAGTTRSQRSQGSAN